MSIASPVDVFDSLTFLTKSALTRVRSSWYSIHVAVSTARHERAQATRRRVCAAARELFLTRGYSATTISEIARAAGVAQQTVYFVFGSKAALLATIMDIEIVGDENAVPLLQRPQVKRLSSIKSRVRRLEQIVAVATDITERLAPLYEIVRGGATDDEVRELLDRHEAQRWTSLHTMLVALDGELAAGVGVEDAADRLYALLSHDVYWLLVSRRGWSSARWRRYVATEAVAQLLGHERQRQPAHGNMHRPGW